MAFLPITFVLVVIALALAFGVIKLFGWPMGRKGSHSYDLLPTWVLAIVLMRAGFIEELYYRGYLIERLQTLTGSPPDKLASLCLDTRRPVVTRRPRQSGAYVLPLLKFQPLPVSATLAPGLLFPE